MQIRTKYALTDAYRVEGGALPKILSTRDAVTCHILIYPTTCDSTLQRVYYTVLLLTKQVKLLKYLATLILACLINLSTFALFV